MVSPKIGPSFFGKNYERYVSELTTEGTIAGEKLTPEERKEGFKKKGDKIDFKNFLEKVLERLPPDAQKKITEGEINRVNFDRYDKKVSKNSSSDLLPFASESKILDSSTNIGNNILPASQKISPDQFIGVDSIYPENSLTTIVKEPEGLDELLKSVREEPEGLDELLKEIRESESVKSDTRKTKIKPSDNQNIVDNLLKANKSLLNTNTLIEGFIKAYEKEQIEEEKRLFKEKDKLKKEQKKNLLRSEKDKKSITTGTVSRISVKPGQLLDDLLKFGVFSALAGLVPFIPKVIEFIQTLPERIEKFFKEDIPNFVSEKFEEFKSFVGGFFNDRFEEVKQFFEDVYTKIDDFTGGRLTEFIDGIKGLGPMIVEKSQEFYKTIDDWTGGRISGAFDWIGKNVIDPLGNFFKEKIDYVGTKAGELWTNFSSSFLNFFGDIKFELPELPDLGVTETLGLTPKIEGPDLTQDLVAVGGTTAANIAPVSGAKGMAVEGMDASQVANQIPNMDVGGKSVQLGTGIAQGGTKEDVQKQISGLREGGAKGVQVLGTGNTEKDAMLQEIVSQNQDIAKFLPATKSATGDIDYQATAAAGTQQIQDNAAMREQASTTVSAMSDNQRGALDVLAKYESGAAGYDAVNQYGTKGGRGVEGFSGDIKEMPQHKGRSLTDMTLSEIKQLQYDDKSMSKEEWINAGKLHAVGRYQFIGNTLPGVAERAGIPDNAKFSPQVQDIMALQLMKERGISPWVGPSDKATAEERAIIERARTEPLPKVSVTSGKPQQRQTQQPPQPTSPKPISAILTESIDNHDAQQRLGTRQMPSTVSTEKVVPNRDQISVTSRRGARWGKMHQGTDIAAPVGTPLHAFTNGVITDTGYEGGYGNYVAWKDIYGMEHFYAHLDKIMGKKGDSVKAGSVIGMSGNTGRGTGPHLHWEYGPEGQTGRNGAGLIDPLDKFDYMMPFGSKKIVSKPEDAPKPVPTAATSAKVSPELGRLKVSADSISKPSGRRSSRSNVTTINMPNTERTIPTVGGEQSSQSTTMYKPNVSPSNGNDMYKTHTRALFNIVR